VLPPSTSDGLLEAHWSIDDTAVIFSVNMSLFRWSVHAPKHERPLVSPLKHTDEITCVACHPSIPEVSISVARDGMVHLVHWRTPSLSKSLSHHSGALHCCMDPEGDTLLVVHEDGAYSLYATTCPPPHMAQAPTQQWLTTDRHPLTFGEEGFGAPCPLQYPCQHAVPVIPPLMICERAIQARQQQEEATWVYPRPRGQWDPASYFAAAEARFQHTGRKRQAAWIASSLFELHPDPPSHKRSRH